MDISLPSSSKEIMNGLFLAVFVGFALSIGTTALFALVRHRKELPIVGRAVVGLVASMIYGGVLVFVLPMWIAATALAIGIVVPLFALWRSP